MLLGEGSARKLIRSSLLVVPLVVVHCALFAQSPAQPALDAAVAAYREGKPAEAERILVALLEDRPGDAGALVLMGVVLDAAQKYKEAEPYYRHALDVAPKSPQVLNNAANHYLAAGDRRRARELFLKTVAVDAHHENANLQLAQMSVEDRQGRQAIAYLSRVPEDLASDAAVQLMRARALALTGQCSESGRILAAFESDPRAGASVHFSAGMARAECKLYDAAEQSFSRALDSEARNFDILYNLGLAALRAGHIERSQSALEIALREKPQDPDTLYALAQVYIERGQTVKSAALLATAEKVAPDRVEPILLLAQITAQLGFYEDSAAAYDRYLKLKPEDDVARRERGFDLARVSQQKGAPHDLEWYVARHPRDGVGYFELAVAYISEDRAKARTLLDKAITLDPSLYRARYTRALLNIEEEDAAAAIIDLELYVQREPKDASGLAHLGQAYLAVNRAADAAAVLERARSIDPDSALVLVHYRKALAKLGRKDEASAVVARLRESGIRGDSLKRRVGLIDYLSLSPEDQRTRYLADLRQQSAADPGNVHLRISLAKELLAQEKTQEGLEIFQHLPLETLPAGLLTNCGKILLEFRQYAAARPFFERTLALPTAPQEARIDLAISIFHTRGAGPALEELDQTPADHHTGDYYLLRAQILDAQGKVQDAAAALNQGMRAAPTRAVLYYEASSFLLKHQLYSEARMLLEQACRILPEDRELLLAQAVTLNLLRQPEESEKLLSKIQARWPEWDRPYLLKGILLETRSDSAEARQALETAIALGANTPEAYYYQALAIMHSAPEELASARNAIRRALTLTSSDPYIFLLAGKISLERKEYSPAIAELLQATRLAPALISAHYALRDAYTALGEHQKSRDELETIKRISKETGGTGESPPSVEDFLFAVPSSPPRVR